MRPRLFLQGEFSKRPLIEARPWGWSINATTYFATILNEEESVLQEAISHGRSMGERPLGWVPRGLALLPPRPPRQYLDMMRQGAEPHHSQRGASYTIQRCMLFRMRFENVNYPTASLKDQGGTLWVNSTSGKVDGFYHQPSAPHYVEQRSRMLASGERVRLPDGREVVPVVVESTGKTIWAPVEDDHEFEQSVKLTAWSTEPVSTIVAGKYVGASKTSKNTYGGDVYLLAVGKKKSYEGDKYDQQFIPLDMFCTPAFRRVGDMLVERTFLDAIYDFRFCRLTPLLFDWNRYNVARFTDWRDFFQIPGARFEEGRDEYDSVVRRLVVSAGPSDVGREAWDADPTDLDPCCVVTQEECVVEISTRGPFDDLPTEKMPDDFLPPPMTDEVVHDLLRTRSMDVDGRRVDLRIRQVLVASGVSLDVVDDVVLNIGDRLTSVLANSPLFLMGCTSMSSDDMRQIMASAARSRMRVGSVPEKLIALADRISKDTWKSGSTYTTTDRLVFEGGVRRDVLLQTAEDLRAIAATGAYVHFEHGAVAPVILDYCERIVAHAVAVISNRPPLIPPDEFASDVPPEDEQDAAVYAAARNRVMTLTGGAGTGKTYVAKRIKASIGGREGVMAVTPTNKASEVLSKSIGQETSTIHSATVGMRDNSNWFYKNVAMLDEGSMLDILVAANFLKLVERNPMARLIVMGDPSQLPSVSPGRLLGDLEKSDRIAHAVLKTVRRRGDDADLSKLIENVQGGKNEWLEEWRGRSGGDVRVVEYSGLADLTKKITAEYEAERAVNPGEHPAWSVMTLTPSRRRRVSRGELVVTASDVVNPEVSKFMAERSAHPGRPERWVARGDKVICVEGSYDERYLNGQSFLVLDVADDRAWMSARDGSIIEVETERGCIPGCDLGWATTIHRSQGDEASRVIILVEAATAWQFNRNMLYTAITRTRKSVVFLVEKGIDPELISKMIQPIDRRTKLHEYISSALPRRNLA